MMAPAFLAVDWGTTNRRVFLIEGGAVTRTERDDHGVTAVPAGGFAAEAEAIRARFGDLPMLLAGMVGSTVGWREAAYVGAPADIGALAAGLLWIDPRTAIVPGVSTLADGRADVMRGEEVQLLGAAAARLAPGDGLFAHPGTHCKWVTMAGGRIAGFTTAMTGELFAILRRHGLLAQQMAGEAVLDDAFRAGVEEGSRRDLTASLFGIRAAKLLGQRDDADAPSFLSGLLIGSDVACRLAAARHGAVYILADPGLDRLYAAAIEAHGRTAHLVDSRAAFVAGSIAIAERLP